MLGARLQILQRAGIISFARTVPSSLFPVRVSGNSRSSHGSSGYNQYGSKFSFSSSSSILAWMGAAGASVASLMLIRQPAESLAPAKPEIVHENVTGLDFPTTLRVPPVYCDIVPWSGSRPGFVYQKGPRGVGYYADKYRGGVNYVKESASASEQQLVGVGMRCMLQKCEFHIARAYAIGCYVDESSLSREDASSVLHSKVNKTLRLIMAREVKGGHIGKGFDRTLIPKLRGITGEKNGPWKEDLRLFTRAFNLCGTLSVGAEVLFCMPGDGALTIYINGREVERIQSQHLCDAVMEMYLGEKNVAPKVKENFVEGFQRAYAQGIRSMGIPPGTSA